MSEILIKIKQKRKPRRQMLLGQTFGRWTVISDNVIIEAPRRVRWECKCDCGVIQHVRSDVLKSGKSKSCGCWNMEVSQLTKLPNFGAPFRVALRSYTDKCKLRGWEWSLSEDRVRELFASNCYYCGIPPLNNSKSRRKHLEDDSFKYNGIDRVDSNIGYIESNIVPCCNICNKAKFRMSTKEFAEWVNRLVLYNTNIELPKLKFINKKL